MEESCCGKLDRYLWNGGELPRTEKAVNYVRPAKYSCCSDNLFLVWRIIAWLISTYHLWQDQYFTYASGGVIPHWQYLTIVGLWMYWLNFCFLLFEHMRVHYN
jgi:hypothetical protein